LNAFTNLRTTFSDIENTVNPTVDMAINMADNLNTTIKASHKTVHTYELFQTRYIVYEYGGVLALFALSILLILLGWFGIGAGMERACHHPSVYFQETHHG